MYEIPPLMGVRISPICLCIAPRRINVRQDLPLVPGCLLRVQAARWPDVGMELAYAPQHFVKLFPVVVLQRQEDVAMGRAWQLMLGALSLQRVLVV